ncbi:LysM domain-containing protein [Sorangium sp. So ce429]
MPVKPDSPYAKLPVLRVKAPDGSTRDVIALRLTRPTIEGSPVPHRVIEGEHVDAIARRFFGDERLFWRVLDANPVVYPLDIRPGDVLQLPAQGPATRTTRARRF